MYETVFESPPPADIWPPPKEDHTPIEISKKAGRIRNEIKALILLLLLIPFVINAYRFLHFNPFTLTGPQFLEFFPLLAVSSILCFIVVQLNSKFGGDGGGCSGGGCGGGGCGGCGS